MTSFAQTHRLGNNVSFAAVGLLWTLAETLSSRRMQDCQYDDKINSNHQQTKAITLFGNPVPALIYTRVNQYAIPLGIYSRVVQPSNAIQLVILEIFNQFRKLATDSRIEVRNCSLRSLIAAYKAARNASTESALIESEYENLDKSEFLVNSKLVDQVGMILVEVLHDVSTIYQTLMRDDKGGQEIDVSSQWDHPLGLVHHSRDSVVKLWDDSVTIIMEGVLQIILDKVEMKDPSFLDFPVQGPIDSLLLCRAASSLCSLIETLLTVPSKKNAGLLSISAEGKSQMRIFYLSSA